MSKNHLVSILIVNYNNAKYLKRAINSCLNQTYKNIEILIYDDKSIDGSKLWLTTFFSKFGLPIKVKNIINGFISGLLASITGMILISVILSQVTLEESLIQLYNQKKLGSLISIGALIILRIFFIAIKKEKYDFALGLVLISLFLVVLITFLKIF